MIIEEFNNGNYRIELNQEIEVTMAEDVWDEDWKTLAIAQNKPWIPKGTTLTGKVMRNLYGYFIDVRFQDYLYSIKPKYCIYK